MGHFLISLDSGTPAQQVAAAIVLLEGGHRVSLVRQNAAVDALRTYPLTVDSASSDTLSLERRERMLDFLGVHARGSCVLLTGETGTGKSVAASDLHQRWSRAENRRQHDRILLRINVATLSDSLLASELFGHEKGAFTGASGQKKGALETVKAGTVLLDEIGELPLELQARLLTVLDPDASGKRHVRRVGGTDEIPVEASLIFATNRDLHALVREGRFRSDLLARLSVHHLRLPRVRDQPFTALIGYLRTFDELAKQRGFEGVTLTRPVWHAMLDFAFSGGEVFPWNLRGVRNSATRLAAHGLPETWSPTPGHATGRSEPSLQQWRAEARRLAEGWKAVTARPLDRPEGEIETARNPPSSQPASRTTTADERDTTLEVALQEGALETMTELERWEAYYLWRARGETKTRADAFRYLRERGLLPTKGDVKNESSSFKQRWSKHAFREDC